jgi:hypothetical protein
MDGRCWQHASKPVPLAAFRPHRPVVERRGPDGDTPAYAGKTTPHQGVYVTIPVTGDLDWAVGVLCDAEERQIHPDHVDEASRVVLTRLRHPSAGGDRREELVDLVVNAVPDVALGDLAQVFGEQPEPSMAAQGAAGLSALRSGLRLAR